MKRLAALFFLALKAVVLTKGHEWCTTVPAEGHSDVAECQPAHDTTVQYIIDVDMIGSMDESNNNNITVTLTGENNLKSNMIPIPSSIDRKTVRIESDDIDVGDILHVNVVKKGPGTWSCGRITVRKDFRYWLFDCDRTLSATDDEMICQLSGNMIYEVIVQTGHVNEGGTKGKISITIGGENGHTGMKVLGAEFSQGKQKRLRFRAADIGEVNEISIVNDADFDPWYCEHIIVKAERNQPVVFTVKRWIGEPYGQSAVVYSKHPHFMTPFAQDIQCHTRAKDLLDRVPKMPKAFVVTCPPECNGPGYTSVEGVTVHPSTSSICSSALLDGVIDARGGEVVVTITGQLQKYDAYEDRSGYTAQGFIPAPQDEIATFYVYGTNLGNRDRVEVQLVNSEQKSPSRGRVEVMDGAGYKPICTKNAEPRSLRYVADFVCHASGFSGGIPFDSCRDGEGVDFCSAETNSAMRSIICPGDANTLQDCSFAESSDGCNDPSFNLAVKCVTETSSYNHQNGAVQLVEPDGFPSARGRGRLEVFLNGQFAPVCSEGWSPQAAVVACQQLGFTTASNSKTEISCRTFHNADFCAENSVPIAMSHVQCKGNEASLIDCPHLEEPDVYCIHEEDVVLECNGKKRDTTDNFSASNSIAVHAAQQLFKLDCSETIDSIPTSFESAGKTIEVECPQNCGAASGVVRGTYIYTEDSPVCKSAVHAGILSKIGGPIAVTIGHEQDLFFGSENNGVLSVASASHSRSITISYVMNTPVITQHGSTYPTDTDAETYAAYELKSKEKLHWNPDELWKGFNGNVDDFVDAKLEGINDETAGITSFTFAARVRVLGGIGQWRTILAHSECGGFQLAVDTRGEVVVEKTCSSHNVRSEIIPSVGEWFHVAISYSDDDRIITLFINGKPVVAEQILDGIALTSNTVIGRSSGSFSDYFVGDIMAVRAFDYALTKEEVLQCVEEAMKSSPKRSHTIRALARRTVDGRPCLTECSAELKPFNATKKQAHNLPISLSCQDTMESSIPDGGSGDAIRVMCPPGCSQDDTPVIGSSLYSFESSICRSGLHSGILLDEGGAMTLTIRNGLKAYRSSIGSNAIVSLPDLSPKFWSFSLSPGAVIRKLTCSDKGDFLLGEDVGAKVLFSCPHECGKRNEVVIGQTNYSAASSVCTAAIHSGVLSEDGGVAELEVHGSVPSFQGSYRNEVQSLSGGRYLRSFSFVNSVGDREM